MTGSHPAGTFSALVCQESVPVPRHAVHATTRVAGSRVVEERSTTKRRERTVLRPRPRQDLHRFGSETAASTKHAPGGRVAAPLRQVASAPLTPTDYRTSPIHETVTCTHVYEL